MKISGADSAKEVLATLASSRDPRLRMGVAFLLGELSERPGTLRLLRGMMSAEHEPAIIEEIGRALSGHLRPRTAATIIGALHEMSLAADGERRAFLGALLRDQALSLGLVESQVEALG